MLLSVCENEDTEQTMDEQASTNPKIEAEDESADSEDVKRLVVHAVVSDPNSLISELCAYRLTLNQCSSAFNHNIPLSILWHESEL